MRLGWWGTACQRMQGLVLLSQKKSGGTEPTFVWLGRGHSHRGFPEFFHSLGSLPLGKRHRKKARTDKYAKKSPATRHLVQHGLWQFHRYLERLINDPYAPNHLDRIADGEPVLREAFRKAGIAGLTREQLLEKRDEYVARLEAGEEPYSSKLYGTEYIPAN